MVEKLKDIAKRHQFKIKGVIHVGAHYGQEYSLYKDLRIKNMIFFEPCSANFKELRKRVKISPLKKLIGKIIGRDFEKEVIIVKKAIGNENKKISINVEIKNKGQSNSILEPLLHLEQYPEILFQEKEEVEMIKLDDAIAGKEKYYNLLVIDVQGYELEVLKGSEKTLSNIDYIVSEVNNRENYANCALIEDIDNFLSKHGFIRAEVRWNGEFWGDAFYVRKFTYSKVILPQIKLNRILPSNNSKKLSYLAKTAEVKLINYGKAYINSKGLVFCGLRLMKDTNNLGYKPSLHEKYKLVVRLYFKSKIKDFKDKNLLTIADGFTTCYYHWMCDNLVRLSLTKEELGDNFLLVLPRGLFDSNFCTKSLEMFGIKKDNIVVIDKKEAATSDNVFFPTSILGGSLAGSSYDSAIIKTRDHILDYCKAHDMLNFSLGERIFISRSKQKKRIILNQKEVDELLLKYNFSIINIEDLSFENGVSVNYNAKYIIGQCSSGLTNIMFAKKGAKILELYPKESYGDDNGGLWFSEMCQAANLEHHYQYCRIDSDNIYINEFHTSMIVNLDELEKNIQSMLLN